VSDLPIMAPACWPSLRPSPRVVGCWARQDDAPPFEAAPESYEAPYAFACGGPPAGPLGLCFHHREQILPEATE
jgi:hypothetical protein